MSSTFFVFGPAWGRLRVTCSLGGFQDYEGLAEKVTNDRSAALKCGSGDVGRGRCRIVMKLAIGMI